MGSTYQPWVYKDNGGNRLTIGASGTLVVEAGATMTMGGILDFATVSPGTETTGSIFTTGSTWVECTSVGGCGMKFLVANNAATGDFATARVRARADAAGATECVSAAASGGINNYGDLYAVRGYAQPNAYTQSGASNIVCAIYGCSQRTGTSSGRTWVGWLDTHMTTKSAAGDYLLRLSHNGTTANDGAITVYNGGRMPAFINFEDAAGCLTDTSASLVTQSGAIAVTTPAGTKYIALYDAP